MELMRICLVEDTEHDVAIVKRIFKKSDITASMACFTSAEEALEELRSSPYSFDIALVDQSLPGMQGIELCQLLISEKMDLPFVLLTGTGSELLAVEALKSGIDDYIIKDSAEQMEAIPYILKDVVKRYAEKKARIKAEKYLKEAYNELAEKTERLEKFQKITMGRESRIMELKEEVNELLARMGEQAKYK